MNFSTNVVDNLDYGGLRYTPVDKNGEMIGDSNDGRTKVQGS